MKVKSVYEVVIPDEIIDIVKHAVSLAKEDITSVWTDAPKDGFRPTISFLCEVSIPASVSLLSGARKPLFR